MKVALVLATCILLSGAAHAQDNTTVVVPKNMLTQQQLQELAARDLADRAQRYGSWVGIGHEVGQAVDEGLKAISDRSNDFANTPVGKWTMYVIIFKVIGQAALGVFFGGMTVLIGLPLWVWSYRRYFPRQRLLRETMDPVGGKVAKREYEMYEVKYANEWKIVHILVLIALFVAAAIAVFANL